MHNKVTIITKKVQSITQPFLEKKIYHYKRTFLHYDIFPHKKILNNLILIKNKNGIHCFIHHLINLTLKYLCLNKIDPKFQIVKNPLKESTFYVFVIHS